MAIQIFATDETTQERFEITDLYWFEENGIHDFGGESHYHKFTFEIFVNKVQVYPPPDDEADPYEAFGDWAAAHGYDLDDTEQREAAVKAYSEA